MAPTAPLSFSWAVWRCPTVSPSFRICSLNGSSNPLVFSWTTPIRSAAKVRNWSLLCLRALAADSVT